MLNLRKKEIQTICNRTNYLLGSRADDGKKVWLEEGKFDCDWYWGFGYIEVYNQNHSDINEHTHFDSLFLEKDLHDSFVKYFAKTTLDEKEIWTLLELMKSFYVAREYADMLYRGRCHISNNPCSEVIMNNEERTRINEVVIPEIMQAVYNMLSPEKEMK